jgi:hypothetical protein
VHAFDHQIAARNQVSPGGCSDHSRIIADAYQHFFGDPGNVSQARDYFRFSRHCLSQIVASSGNEQQLFADTARVSRRRRADIQPGILTEYIEHQLYPTVEVGFAIM